MSAFRTHAQVDPGGVLMLLGLPFAAGARVQIAIESRAECKLDSKPMEGMHPALDVEKEIFRSSTSNGRAHARIYLHGLMQARAHSKNMERLEDAVAGANEEVRVVVVGHV